MPRAITNWIREIALDVLIIVCLAGILINYLDMIYFKVATYDQYMNMQQWLLGTMFGRVLLPVLLDGVTNVVKAVKGSA